MFSEKKTCISLYKISDKHTFEIITQLIVRNVISAEGGENF